MIAISAGHFGIGTGAVGIIDEVEEAVKVVQQVTKNLQQQRIAVTTIIDKQSTSQRQNLAYLREQHAKANRKVDVFVHFNATVRKEERGIGTEVLYKDDSMRQLAANLSKNISEASGLKNRGAKKRQDLYMLNTSTAGGVLIEVCFVNSKQDVILYKQHFLEICRAISNVLCDAIVQRRTNDHETISSPTLQRKYTNIILDKTFQKRLIEEAIIQKVIQTSWLKKFEQNLVTTQDVQAIAIIFLKKQIF